MQLSTPIPVSPVSSSVQYQQPVLLWGSCFSEHIAARLQYYGFTVYSNSHGIIYNPVSLATAVHEVARGKVYTENDLVQHHHQYISWHHHGSFSRPQAEQALQVIQQPIDGMHRALPAAGHAFITLGSAWVYEHVSSGRLVANCHKVPGNQFNKRLLSLPECVQALQQMAQHLRAANPHMAITFTLSPVKHLRDGFVQNQHSKSLLHVAIQQVVHQTDNLYYFPAYEIMQDELRDYRFWSDDMMHPNTLAISCIWEKLVAAYMSAAVQQVMREADSVQKLLAHRPLTHNAHELVQLAQQKSDSLKVFQQKHPYCNISYEG